ncbi:MAG: hypothetical protein GKR90_10020 [Pseudomonadales bacterium]|nr:hypothetical protein [Pseudomonadales bacterium]
MSNNESPFQVTPVEAGFQVSFEVRTVKSQRQTKKAQFDKFEIICDEGQNMGGDNSAPPPLAYFASSVAF